EAQIVRDFQRSGKSPQSAVIEASDGFLYGTTQQGGGISEGGTVYKIAKDGSGFTLLKSFDCFPGTGCNPRAALLEGSDGFLYGTTAFAGPGSGGTLFRIATDGSGYSMLHLLDTLPSSVIEASDGLLYGTALGESFRGSGTIFRIAKDGTGFTIL